MPSAPADIKAVTSGESSAIVSWRAPALSNGIIQKYTVYRREIISGKEVNDMLNVYIDTIQHKFRIPNIFEYSAFSIFLCRNIFDVYYFSKIDRFNRFLTASI